MLTAHLDFETRSAVDLIKQGLYRYAEDQTTEMHGFRYRIGSVGPIGEWRPGWADPQDLLDHIRAGGMVAAHNAAFERTIWNVKIVEEMCPHWPRILIKYQDCTLARASAIAHPQGLALLGVALRMNTQKDMVGNALMKKLAKPRSYNPDGSIVWWGTPEEVDRVMEYCGTDIETETEADHNLPPLTARSRKDWELDQVMNERGIRFDLDMARKCTQLTAFTKKENDKVIRDITDRAVGKCSQDAKIIAWINGRGIECTSIAKGHIDDVKFLAQLAEDDKVLDVLKLRGASWKTSTAKYKKMVMCANTDDKIRGLINWHGASTGRRAGRLVQPQNFKRIDPDDDNLREKIRWLYELMQNPAYSIRDVHSLICAVHGPLEIMDLLSCALRSTMIASNGRTFVSGDFSNVEGRINAWISGEMWKVQAFYDYDNRIGPDLYKLAYARSFGVDVASVGKGKERQIGKVQELSLGYQGGVGAYVGMAANYGVTPFDMTKPVMAATSPAQWDATAMRYANSKRKNGLMENEWVALTILVDNWRAAHPNIVNSWSEYQDAAVAAVASPGSVIGCVGNRISYYFDQRMLWCTLPSGRSLCYPDARLKTEKFQYVSKKTGELEEAKSKKVIFEGMDTITHQWKTQSLYGGLQCNNNVQGIAADMLIDAMFKAEEVGFEICLTVHDELVAERDDARTDLDDKLLEKIMSQTDPIYAGLPTAVSAWQDKRYVK